jgi:DNA-binding protein HU-beta
MKKIDLIQKVAEKSGASQKDVNSVIDALQDVILEEVLNNGEEVAFPKIGKFVQKVNPAHEGFNPIKKEKIQVAEMHTIKFKTSPTIRVKIEDKKRPLRKSKK